MDAVRVEGGDRATAGGSEPDDGGPEPAAVVAGGTDELQGVQHRAVPRELVVLVEDVQAELAVVRPVVHRLEGDQGQTPVDGQLGDLLVLHAVRPAPQDLPVPQFGEVLRQRLGQQDDVAVGDQPRAGQQPGDQWRQPLVGHAEAFAVALFEKDVPAQVGIDPLDVQRVDRQPPLILLRSTVTSLRG